MHYYWPRIQNTYNVQGTLIAGIIINDFAWFFLEQNDTPLSLYNAYCRGDYREPHDDEHCAFTTWYNDIAPICRRISLPYVLFETTNFTESEVSEIIHLAPCGIIREFIKTMAEESQTQDNDTEVYCLDGESGGETDEEYPRLTQTRQPSIRI